MLQQIKYIISELVGSGYLYFDTGLQVKLSPHSLPFVAWAVCVSPKDDVYVMDASEQWWPIEEKDSLIVSSLYQRLQIISEQYQIAS